MTLLVATPASSWVSGAFPRAGRDIWDATDPGPIPNTPMGCPQPRGLCVQGP